MPVSRHERGHLCRVEQLSSAGLSRSRLVWPCWLLPACASSRKAQPWALNGATGKVVWFDTRPRNLGPLPAGNFIWHDDPTQPGLYIISGRGWTSRGVAYWTDGRDARVISVVGQSLLALNAKTGKRYAD